VKLFKLLLRVPEWMRSKRGENTPSEPKASSPALPAAFLSAELEQRLDGYRESRRTEYALAHTTLDSGGMDALVKFWGEGGGEESARLARELREFCLTTGQDLSAVDRFIQDVDAEFSFEFL
jgi:hypothetical protein